MDTTISDLGSAIIGLDHLISLKLINPNDKIIHALHPEGMDKQFSSLKSFTILMSNKGEYYKNPSLSRYDCAAQSAIIQLISRSPNLELLAIEGGVLDMYIHKSDCLYSAIKELKNLQHLSLTSFKYLDLNTIFQSSIKGKNLYTLKLRGRLPNSAISNPPKIVGLENLKELYLDSNSKFLDRDILNNIKGTALRKLTLANMYLEEKIEETFSKFTNLESLGIMSYYEGNQVTVCNIIKSLPQLTSLKIKGILYEPEAEKLINTIKNKCNIHNLEINSCAWFNNESLIKLSEMLTNFTDLQYLGIKGIYNDEGLIKLTQTLKYCKNLNSIRIRSPHIHETSLKEITRLICDSLITIAKLNYPCTFFSQELCEIFIASILRKEEQFQVVLRDSNPKECENKLRAINYKSPVEKTLMARKHNYNQEMPSLLNICTFFVTRELRKDNCQLKLGKTFINRDNIAKILTDDLISRLQK